MSRDQFAYGALPQILSEEQGYQNHFITLLKSAGEAKKKDGEFWPNFQHLVTSLAPVWRV